MPQTLFATLIAGSALVFASAAHAADDPDTCGARDQIVSHLKTKYDEMPRATGLGDETRMVEIWASPKNGTWTILITQANGTSCIAAAGQNWLESFDTPEVAGITG